MNIVIPARIDPEQAANLYADTQAAAKAVANTADRVTLAVTAARQALGFSRRTVCDTTAGAVTTVRLAAIENRDTTPTITETVALAEWLHHAATHGALPTAPAPTDT